MSPGWGVSFHPSRQVSKLKYELKVQNGGGQTRKTTEIRVNLLALEAQGHSKQEIVAFLSDQYKVSPSSIYRHFRNRAKWQAAFLGSVDPEACLHQTVSRLEHLYRETRILRQRAPDPNTQLGALRTMVDIVLKKAEILGVPPAMKLQADGEEGDHLDLSGCSTNELEILEHAERILGAHTKLRLEEFH